MKKTRGFDWGAWGLRKVFVRCCKALLGPGLFSYLEVCFCCLGLSFRVQALWNFSPQTRNLLSQPSTLTVKGNVGA